MPRSGALLLGRGGVLAAGTTSRANLAQLGRRNYGQSWDESGLGVGGAPARSRGRSWVGALGGAGLRFLVTVTFQFSGKMIVGDVNQNINLKGVIWVTKPHKNGFL